MSVLAGRPLEGQVVAILGGSGRMGAAVAEEVVGLGARALLIGRDEAALGRAAAALCDRARNAVADASDEEALRRVLRGNGPIDHVVVAVSAGTPAGGIADTAPAAAQAAFGRLWTSYAVLHLAPGVLPPHGSVTLLSGSSARTPAPGAGVWTALHGAIEALRARPRWTSRRSASTSSRQAASGWRPTASSCPARAGPPTSAWRWRR